MVWSSQEKANQVSLSRECLSSGELEQENKRMRVRIIIKLQMLLFDTIQGTAPTRLDTTKKNNNK